MTEGRPAVFFDRDGTLNEEVDFVSAPAQLQLIAGAGNAVRAVNEGGFLACVISNQSGIARGFFSEADLVPIHGKLQDDLHAFGARIDRIYYCPHHPTLGIEPYRRECECRKPRPGMLQWAVRDLGVDLGRSYVIGDRVVDVLAGRNAGARGILVLTGYGRTALQECKDQGIEPEFVAPSVTEAVQYVLRNHTGAPNGNA